MYGVWKAEIITGRPQPWAAHLFGLDKRWGFRRQFITGVRDYSYGQEHHTRGVYLYFNLPPGLYEVFRSISWRHEERYFFQIDDNGDLYRMSKDNVESCLKNAI